MNIVFLVILALIFVFFKYYFIPKIKGKIGENEVSNILGRLNLDEYTVLNNVKIKIKDSISQIDHIIVSDYWIFVIEKKNYKWWILGYEKNKYWIQVIYKYKKKFYNPILQNQGHIYSLKHILRQYKSIKYISVIVFTKKSTLKTKTFTDVIQTNSLIRTIKQHHQKNISRDIKSKIIEEILLAQKSKNPKIKVKSNEIQESKICPKCDGKLLEKNGKHGRFIGCENFPKCRFTTNH